MGTTMISNTGKPEWERVVGSPSARPGRWLQVLMGVAALVMGQAACADCSRAVVGSVTLPAGDQANAVFVSGSHAYVAHGDSLQIVDLGNPANPVIAGSLPTTAWATDVFVSGGLAYLAMSGLEIIDVSDPAAPSLVEARGGGYLNGVHLLGSDAYLAGERYSGNWAYLRNYDVSDPNTWTFIGDRALESYAEACDIHVADGHAYLADCSTGKLWVVDLNNSLAHVYTGPAASYSGQYSGQGVFADSRYAYVAADKLYVFDVSNKQAITPVNPKGGVGGRGLYVANNLAYSGVYNGLYVQDVSDPAAITFVDKLMTQGEVAVRDVAPWGQYMVVVTANSLQVLHKQCPAPPDGDGDGVVDAEDSCPGTAASAKVDGFGCSADQNMDQLLRLYAKLDLRGYERIPGSPTNGPWANMRSILVGRGEDKTVTRFDGNKISIGVTTDGGIECGNYQGTLLVWLDALRNSKRVLPGETRRTYADLFSNVYYGPIQAFGGAHQAVIIYPKGKSWRLHGTVLDPWYYQNTKHYAIYRWGVHFNDPVDTTSVLSWVTAQPSVVNSEGPLYGTDYPDNIRALQEAALAERRAMLRRQKVRVTADCRVAFAVTDIQTNKRIGVFPKEGFVNEIPGAFMVAGYLEGKDDIVWHFALPKGNYRLQGQGQASDQFSVQTAHELIGLYDYGNNPVDVSHGVWLDIDRNRPRAALVLDDGSRVRPKLTLRPQWWPAKTPILDLLLAD